MILSEQYIKDKMLLIEGNIVSCFWENPSLFYDYSDLQGDCFKNGIWKFYFAIGKLLVTKESFNVLDKVSVETYMYQHKEANQAYSSFGGYTTIELLPKVDSENLEAWVDQLFKLNALYKYVEKLQFSEQDFEDFLQDYNTDELYDYLSANINHIFVGANNDVKTSKLNDDLDKIIDEAHKGINRGMPLNSEILSEEIGGVMLGQIILMAGLSGTGKTTITQELFLKSVWENEEPTLIILNEQPREKWTQQFLTWIINNKVIPADSNKRFVSKRWRDGNFTNEEFEWLGIASSILNSKLRENKIVFAELDSYTCKKCERLIRKYSYLGFKRFVIDTFKVSSDRGNEQAWLSMQEDMRKLDDLIKPKGLNVSLWVTLQLQKGSVLNRYLTGQNIGMAKNVVDVASVALLMRKVRNDEYENGRFEIEVIKPIGNSKKSGQKITLDPNKTYVILFIEKNRNGESQSYQIVAEQNLGTLEYKEIGICDIPFDT